MSEHDKFSSPLISIFLLVFAATMSSAAQSPNQAVVVPEKCAAKLISYLDWERAKKPQFALKIKAKSGGRIYYYGAKHSTDTAHRQFQEIEAAWSQFEPDVAFYEGPNRPVFDTRDETIQKTGESGYVRFLAKRTGTRFITLEPPPADEVKHLRTNFSSEQVMLFFVLREAVRLRERQKLSEEDLKKQIAALLVRASQIPGLEEIAAGVDLVKFEADYRRHWKTPANWRQAPQAWFDPLKKSADTGGIFTNDVNRASSEFRNRYMYELLAKHALAGKSVFAVVGRSHVPMQAEALKCALR